MPMTPQQRSAAADKAAATKRRNAAAARAGYAPPPPPRPTPPPPPPGATYTPPPPPPPRPAPTTAFTTAKPTVASQRLVVVAALDDLYALVCRERGMGVGLHTTRGCCADHDKLRDTYDRFKKVLNLALAPATNQAMQNEASVALSTAAINLVKQTF